MMPLAAPQSPAQLASQISQLTRRKWVGVDSKEWSAKPCWLFKVERRSRNLRSQMKLPLGESEPSEVNTS